MKKGLIAFILVGIGFISHAQKQKVFLSNRPLNIVSVNLLGDASLISGNYERLFLERPQFIASGKVGLGYNEEFQICFWGPCPSGPKQFLTIPHHITGNLGSGRHYFEFGLGGTIMAGPTRQRYIGYPMIGYRILPLNSNKINFRIFAQIPFTGLDPDDYIFVPFGLNLGISF